MSDLNDPRVLFAAERTLMAWSRTAAGLMAFGFLIDRSAMIVGAAPARPVFAFCIGLAFVLLGVLLSALSVVQYRRSVATLRPVEIPPGYWVNLSLYASGLIGLLGIALALYLTVS
jgi:putative membrane protein